MEFSHAEGASPSRESEPTSEVLRAETARLRSENARLSERVAELQREHRHAESVCQLAAGAVHDFRNALTVVLNEVELLEELSIGPAQRDAVNAASNAARHAVSVAHGILRIAARDRERAAAADSVALLRQCRPLVESVLRAGRARLVFDGGNEEAWSVRVDVVQLEAALVNLVSNARDALGEGGTVRVGAANLAARADHRGELAPGDYVAFFVEDDGCGMPAAVRERAREAFFTTKPLGEGTGLGLAMVQAFAAHAGGALRIESHVGRGTRVEILLPRADPAASFDEEDPRYPAIADIQRRVRSGWLGDLLGCWSKACPREGLPSPVRLESELGSRKKQTILVAAGPNEGRKLRVVRMGADLARALDRSGGGSLSFSNDTALGSLARAYRGACRSRTPSYEFVRHSFGQGTPVQFERLLLPASTDGRVVSHVLGAIELPGKEAM